MNSLSPFLRFLPACLSLSAIPLGPGVPVAPARDLAEVFAELGRTNQRRGRLESRQFGIEALLGGGWAGTTLSEGGKSVGIRPVGGYPEPAPSSHSDAVLRARHEQGALQHDNARPASRGSKPV